ncbi:retrograde regulation protein 2 [Naematelia encephala]|uniref:Retrograde regulation protein 2 n=1 Tax=Naematelia encephala TaxID=71784 RepID=A0A1Y2AK71_9TREE|nr:retrograde regulation protein 2 [Naematelia encephala]
MITDRDEEEKGAEHNVSAVVDDTLPQWDEARKRKLYRKVDLHVLPSLIILYLISFIDRGTLANASILGIKTDLHLDTTKYNLVATVFLFTYSAFEIPANAVLQKVKPNIWIATICLAWGIVATMSGLVKNYAGALVARIFLGVAEAGFFPGAVFLVSLWYPREQLQFRISVFFSMGSLAGAFSGLIAYGVAHMEGKGGLRSWRWLFILEGIFTCALAPCILWILPNSPESSKWLDEEEKAYLRSVSVLAGGGGTHVPFQKEHLYAALKDVKIWLCGIMGMGTTLPLYGFSYSLPTVLVQLGYKAEIAQLMTVPLYAVAAVWTITVAIVSDKIGRRAPGVLVSFSLALIGLAAEWGLPKTGVAKTRYGCLFFIPAGLYAALPGSLSWGSNNAAPRGKRAMATALQLTVGNISAAIGTNVFLGKEAPNYPTGYGISIAVLVLGIICAGVLWLMCNRENKRRDGMDINAIQATYSDAQLEAMGDKSPLFRYIT